MLSSATLDSNSFSALRRQETRRIVRYLADRARAGLAVNVGEQIFVTILNVIIDVVGKPNVSDFYPVLSRFDLQGLAKRVRRSAQRMDRMFDRIISQRVGMDKGSKGNGGDFLMVLLNAKDEDENMSMNHVKALLMDMVLGGTDTSLNTIEFAMAELINKPEIMKRAQQELDKVFINVWAIHRNPNVWENPLEFNPDRFLDKGYDFSGNDYSYFPFGSGRRICAGMAMAEKVVLYNLATLLHSFDWRIGEGEKVELEEKFGILLKLKNPLVATPVLRLSDPNLFL
ncbi:unnamed protein product [Arabidopsis thaliana]|uniref:(thale cress) hypothetical protein n=1 Tax=Arabidopsis thaliana TaxID=3702 RepID=A0A7G2EYZ1_ARATH|nr:unnamed protein product [Arabidopsis thaliana]